MRDDTTRHVIGDQPMKLTWGRIAGGGNEVGMPARVLTSRSRSSVSWTRVFAQRPMMTANPICSGPPVASTTSETQSTSLAKSTRVLMMWWVWFWHVSISPEKGLRSTERERGSSMAHADAWTCADAKGNATIRSPVNRCHVSRFLTRVACQGARDGLTIRLDRLVFQRQHGPPHAGVARF
ncbi:MAG: hypothetical protein MZV65_41745 [Chromatiales bacterium]|nr:hypothetical protein [Chromatiales bacterium]